MLTLETLMAALQVLSRSPVDLDEPKELLTIIYHSDEAAQPTARAWVRASQWMHSANPSDLQGVEVRFKRMFHDLKKAAAIIEEIYGEEDTKYIVPIEYRSRVRREA